MDCHRFDFMTRSLSRPGSRRHALAAALCGALGGFGLVPSGGAAAKKHHRKKCAKAGQKTSRKRKKCCSGLDKDGSRRCCKQRTCPANGCGNHPDGCGGTLSCGGCPADQICLRSGVCQVCTVTCPNGATDCGAALETTMAGGGTIYVCPGTYQKPSGSFLVSKSVTVIGAGEGGDPASNTILQGSGSARVVTIDSATVINATFQDLRITGGVVGGAGGGIYNGDGNVLSLVGCTITGNKAQGSSGFGGGISTSTGARLNLTDCTITDNSSENSGAGIRNFDGRVTITNSTIRGNTAIGSQGGGIATDAGTVALDTTSRVTGNGARPADPDSGGGIFNSSEFKGGGTVNLASAANVTGNTPDNCGGEPVPGCVD
jgi:hypothetical protein